MRRDRAGPSTLRGSGSGEIRSGKPGIVQPMQMPPMAEAADLARQILQVLLLPIVVQGKEVVLSGSIGIALGDTGAATPQKPAAPLVELRS